MIEGQARCRHCGLPIIRFRHDGHVHWVHVETLVIPCPTNTNAEPSNG